MKNKSLVFLDVLGISSATVCLIHCLVFPILTILPLEFTDNEFIDVAFSCLGMFVVSKIILGNASVKVKIILGISIVLIITGVLIEILFDQDSWLILVGGLGMITGHIMNYKSHFNQH